MSQEPRPLDPSRSPKALFGYHLRHLRERARLSQAGLGRALFASDDAVATWEKGRSLPDEPTAVRLDERLSGAGLLLASWRLAASGHADSHADSEPNTPRDAPEPYSMDSAPTTPEALLAASAREAAGFGAWAEQSSAGGVTITSLHIRVKQLAAECLTMPPATVIGPAADLAREIFDLLRTGRHKPAHTRDLYAAAAQACALLTWLSGDLGSLDSADLHGATATVCAEHADEPETTAWVAAVRSKTAFWRQDYHQAAHLARQGLSAAAPGTASVMLACQEADAYAMLGATDRLGAALVRAEHEAECQRGADSIGGLFSCGPARHANYASAGRLALGDPAAALAECGRAAAEFQANPVYGFGTVAQVQLTEVFAYAAAGDLDAVAAAVRPVLDLPAGRRLATLTERLRPLAGVLDTPAMARSTVAAPLRAEIAEFCRVGGRPQLTAGTPMEDR